MLPHTFAEGWGFLDVHDTSGKPHEETPRGSAGFHIVAHDVRSVWNPAYAVFDSSTGGKWLRSPWPPAGR